MRWWWWCKLGSPGLILVLAIAEGHGDTAVVLMKAGAETDKRDAGGALAIELAPDAKVSRI